MSELVVVDGPGELAAPEAEPAAARRSRRRRPNRPLEVLWLVLGIGAIAGIVYGVAVLLGSTVLSPQAWAERYVSLIAEGRFDEASAAADPGIEPEFAALLSDGALEGGEGISALAVTLIEQSGPSATVRVAYELAGEPHEAELSLWRRTSFFGLASEWRVSTPLLGSMRLVSAGPDQLSVGGVDVLVPGTAILSAYPGVYPIGLAGGEQYFDMDGEPEAVVVSNDTVEVPVTVLATDALREAVAEGVTALIDECAKSDDIAPPGCPFAGRLFDEYKDLVWRITDYPVVELSADGATFSSSSDGRAYAKFQQENFAGRGWVDGSLVDGFPVSGTVTIVDGEVSVSLDDGAGGALFD